MRGDRYWRPGQVLQAEGRELHTAGPGTTSEEGHRAPAVLGGGRRVLVLRNGQLEGAVVAWCGERKYPPSHT
jgi:hypothetical protein